MSVLCISPIPLTTNYSFDQVPTLDDCLAFVAQESASVSLLGLTYTDANELIAATSLLFVIAFIIRLTLKKLGY